MEQFRQAFKGAIQFVSSELNKAGLTLSDEDIYSIIKTAIGYINVQNSTNKSAISEQQ